MPKCEEGEEGGGEGEEGINKKFETTSFMSCEIENKELKRMCVCLFCLQIVSKLLVQNTL